MSKILLDTGLIIEHSKTELFHFTRAWHLPNLSIDLTFVEGPIISPKPIWWYLGFYFDCKLNFNYHTHFYATKCLSTLSTMKMLENSSRGLFPIQKWLLYRMYILPIALYKFQLWFFKKAPIVKNLTELKKIQWRAALWITGTFQTSPLEGICKGNWGTRLQENPQRLGWGSWRDVLHYILVLHSGSLRSELN